MVNLLKALILAGGYGTRLRPLSCTRPKILFPIVNKPLLEWTFENLGENNIEEVILAVNQQTEIFIKHSRIRRHGIKVLYSRDPVNRPLGTGGPIRNAERLLDPDEAFLVLNGDIFAQMNYQELLEFHKKTDATATIALHEVEDPSRYGVADVAKDSRITRFIEKPAPEEAPANLINAGVYALDPRILKYIPRDKKVSMETHVFPKLAEQGELYGHVLKDLWMDIGQLEDYLEINKVLLKSSSRKSEAKPREQVKIKDPVAFDRDVLIGRRSTIGPYTVLGQNVHVGRNVRIRESIILSGTVIDDSCSIHGAIIGENVNIGKGVKIQRGCVLGDQVNLKDGIALAENVSICPGKEISEDIQTSGNII